MEADNQFGKTNLTWDYSDPINVPTSPAPFYFDATIFAYERTGFYEIFALRKSHKRIQ